VEHSRNICRTVISGKEEYLNEQFPYFFNTLCTFWPNSTLFQGVENRKRYEIRSFQLFKKNQM